PRKHVQEKMLELSVISVKKMSGKARAAYVYYVVNLLHLYNDGNGRVGRLLFQVLNNPNYDYDVEDFTHHANDVGEIGTRDEFVQTNHIKLTKVCRNLERYLMANNWVKSGLADGEIIKYRVRTDTPESKVPEVYFTKDATQNLTKQQQWNVRLAFFNPAEAVYPLMKMLKNKNKSREVIEKSLQKNNDNIEMIVAVDAKNPLSILTFEGWTAKDYLEFISQADAAAYEAFAIISDLFLHPQKYLNNDGKSWLSYLIDSN
ncbi:Fic family protein, partial [Candidatus Saccharibacteria bacterium]|nr:Fic family protein [Candidatus Saccharibacteria bacterium]